MSGDHLPRRRGPRDGLIARTPEVRHALARQLAEARLRLVAPLLIVTIGAMCLRDSILAGRSLTLAEWALAGLATFATLLLFIPGIPTWSIPKLETTIVWLAGGYLAVRAYDPRSWLPDGEVGMQTLRHLDHTAASLGLLIVAYAIAVPNTPRRAAAILMPLAAAPLVVSLARLAGNPNIVSFGSLAGILMTDALLVPMAATSLGLYAVYLLERYRSQLEQARDEGRYELVRQIGVGGMGEVWLARHHMLARLVALKMIRAERLGGGHRLETTWRRFEQEAQAIASLRSVHTVELYDFGITSDETFYYVMEYLPGLDLERLIEQHGPLALERAIYLLRQVCDALGDAHASGLIHRDIKPANILACRMGTEHDFVKVLDFGLVKSLRGDPVDPGLTADGLFVGTPAYAAPEIARGDSRVDGAADIYSLGCVAYWLLTGRRVFENDSPVALLSEHIKTVPEPPSRIRPTIPPDLDVAVMCCLEKDPAQRPSAAELDAALAACAVPRTWDPERARQWWERNEPRQREFDAPAD